MEWLGGGTSTVGASESGTEQRNMGQRAQESPGPSRAGVRAHTAADGQCLLKVCCTESGEGPHQGGLVVALAGAEPGLVAVPGQSNGVGILGCSGPRAVVPQQYHAHPQLHGRSRPELVLTLLPVGVRRGAWPHPRHAATGARRRPARHQNIRQRPPRHKLRPALPRAPCCALS